MIVGFSITDFRGNEASAVEYIKRVCILESPKVAESIVRAGTGINIYSRNIVASELAAQPFGSRLIETIEGTSLLISMVNYNLEITFNGRPLRLSPAEFIYIDPSESFQFKEYLNQNLVKIVPPEKGDDGFWILTNTNWNDNGIWGDDEAWQN